MWSFLREKSKVVSDKAKAVSDHAKVVAENAAENAGRVFQVAAIDHVPSSSDHPASSDPDPPHPSSSSDTDFPAWNFSQPQPPFQTVPPPPAPPDNNDAFPPPPPSPPPPPPPPQAGLAPPSLKPVAGVRSSRYVVTGVNTSTLSATFPTPTPAPVANLVPVTPSTSAPPPPPLDDAGNQDVDEQLPLEPTLPPPPADDDVDFEQLLPPPPPPVEAITQTNTELDPSAYVAKAEPQMVDNKQPADAPADDTNAWGFGDDDWDVPQSAPADDASHFAVPSSAAPRTPITTHTSAPKTNLTAPPAAKFDLVQPPPQAEPSPSAFFDNPPPLPEFLRPLNEPDTDLQPHSEQTVEHDSSSLEFGVNNVPNGNDKYAAEDGSASFDIPEHGNGNEDFNANVFDRFELNEQVKSEPELMDAFETSDSAFDSDAKVEQVVPEIQSEIDAAKETKVEKQLELPLQVKDKVQLAHDVAPETQSQVKREPELIADAFEQLDDDTSKDSEKNAGPQLIELPKTEPEYDPDDDVGEEDANMVANAFALPEMNQINDDTANAFGSIDTGEVASGSDPSAFNSAEVRDNVTDDLKNSEPVVPKTMRDELSRNEMIADAFGEVMDQEHGTEPVDETTPDQHGNVDMPGTVANPSGETEVNRKAAVANTFGFEFPADSSVVDDEQDVLEPQPWPVSESALADEPTERQPADEVPNTQSEEQLQKNASRNDTFEVHVGDSKASEAQISWTDDLPKPSASGQFSDDVNWYTADNAAPEALEELSFEEGFESQKQTTDQVDEQPAIQPLITDADDEWGQYKDETSQGVGETEIEALQTQCKSETGAEQAEVSQHTLDDQATESVTAAQTSVTASDASAEAQGPIGSFTIDSGHKLSTHDAAGKGEFPMSNGLPESHHPSQQHASNSEGFCEQVHDSDTAWNTRRVDADYESTAAELASINSKFESASRELQSRTNEVQVKHREIESLCTERDSMLARVDHSEKESNMFRETMDQLRRELATRDQELANLSSRIDGLLHERDALIEERVIAERERDLAVERGGDGLREARTVIEDLRNHRATAEVHEAAMGEEVQEMRGQLDRVSAERNHLISQMDGLRNTMADMESESMNKCDELNKLIKIAETEAEIARFEREKLIDSSNELKEEIRKAQEAEQERVVALARSDSRVKELEMQLQSGDRFREEEAMRIEGFTGLVEEMKDQTRGIIAERNTLYDEKVALQSERDNFQNELNQVNRKLRDVEREMASLIGEREEWKQTCESLREQMRETTRRQEAISAERDHLLQKRAEQSSVSEREKALALECEQKTRAVAILQKKLTSAISKIEKLTAQRSTVQRQRDDTGMRLRAAGAEFLSLNNKLEETMKARDEFQKQMVSLRDDRDTALTKVQELSELKPKVNILSDNIDAKEKELEQTWEFLQDEQRRNEKLVEESAVAHRKCSTLTEDLKEARAQVDIVSREKDLLKSRISNFDAETTRLVEELKQVKTDKTTLESSIKETEAQRATTEQKAERDVATVRSELIAEQKARAILEEKLATVERDVIARQTMEDEVRRSITAFLASAQASPAVEPLVESNRLNLAEIAHVLSSDNDPKVVTQAVMKLCDATQTAFDEFGRVSTNVRQLEQQHAKATSQVEQYTFEIEQLQRLANDSSQAEAELSAMRQRTEIAEAEIANQMKIVAQLQQELHDSRQAESDAKHHLEVLRDQMREEVDENARKWATENAMATSAAEHATSKLQSIWTMLERAIGSEQAKEIWDDADYNEDNQADKVAVAAFRATASMVAEIGRKRMEAADLGDKLRDSDAEVVRLIDRSEIAERERDALRGTVERVQRKAEKAHDEGMEEARVQFEAIIQRLEDEAAESKDEVSRMIDKVSRSDKEASELRELCNKITAQLSGRTNELDQAEESLAYAQDQVASLEEDLQEAHRRLKLEGEESEQSRQHEVEKLSKELVESRSQLEAIESECADLRIRCDQAEKVATESQLVAQTHKRAEENLQIAIEQLEAAQQSAVVQRTFELEKRVRELSDENERAKQVADSAQVSQKQLILRDDEIRELRGAIGRLSDERVELKMELEKNLSRLNHPDAGGQLVDRRVVRQLLVSYFRVGSVRRRDVLQLMSRMLAFSDTDNEAVGLKRRALMDRIGSLVQAPDTGDASLPPIGTVSDKWIEFLMKETEEGDDQEGKW